MSVKHTYVNLQIIYTDVYKTCKFYNDFCIFQFNGTITTPRRNRTLFINIGPLKWLSWLLLQFYMCMQVFLTLLEKNLRMVKKVISSFILIINISYIYTCKFMLFSLNNTSLPNLKDTAINTDL